MCAVPVKPRIKGGWRLGRAVCAGPAKFASVLVTALPSKLQPERRLRSGRRGDRRGPRWLASAVTRRLRDDADLLRQGQEFDAISALEGPCDRRRRRRPRRESHPGPATSASSIRSRAAPISFSTIACIAFFEREEIRGDRDSKPSLHSREKPGAEHFQRPGP
jgi:hypothetical protein